MKEFEIMLKSRLENIQSEPSEGLLEKIMTSATADRVTSNKNNGVISRQKSRKLFLKPMLAGAICVIFITTASALGIIPFMEHVGEIIETLLFDVFNVNKVDTIIIPNVDGSVHSEYFFNITDPEVKSNGILLDEYFTTFEKAEEHLNFNIKGLTYLPDGVSFRDIFVPNDNECTICYERKGSDGLIETVFAFSQKYVGKNAQIYVNTVADIEKIIIGGDIEAFLQTTMTNGYPRYNYMLMWIKDSVGYTLSLSTDDKDEFIKMAESVD